jgi:hypothetical protein
MTWDAYHHRGEVLRTVIDEANHRLDGALPMERSDVRDTFADEFDLVAALQLRWHTRLSGRIERALLEEPAELESAVLEAWRGTADEMPGVREILDAQRANPSTPEIREALEKAHRKDLVLLAAMAGKASTTDPAAVRVGQRIEDEARTTYDPSATPRHRGEERSTHASLLDRVKSRLVA